MIGVEIIEIKDGDILWQGFVPCLPPPGSSVVIMMPPEHEGGEPIHKQYAVQGCVFLIMGLASQAPDTIKVQVHELNRSKIVTAPGIIH